MRAWIGLAVISMAPQIPIIDRYDSPNDIEALCHEQRTNSKSAVIRSYRTVLAASTVSVKRLLSAKYVT